jgi:hypothetical protein
MVWRGIISALLLPLMIVKNYLAVVQQHLDPSRLISGNPLVDSGKDPNCLRKRERRDPDAVDYKRLGSGGLPGIITRD